MASFVDKRHKVHQGGGSVPGSWKWFQYDGGTWCSEQGLVETDFGYVRAFRGSREARGRVTLEFVNGGRRYTRTWSRCWSRQRCVTLAKQFARHVMQTEAAAALAAHGTGT